ncbi:MAG: hypothetical protein ACI8U3_002160 [Brevundimonas sp.]|jgi:hypothetical protein|uniref:hypothetical protein n=1 Tax=Brevundimonas sp. TaxID=1871086 RepID=UPI0039E33008
MSIELAALHKHWLAADAVNVHLRRSMKSSERLEAGDLPEPLAALAEQWSAFEVLRVWYSLLYVVVEGYQTLKLRDDAVDDLLGRGDYLQTLRLFRNATFHFQKDPFSPKILGFLTTPESETWVKELDQAFKRLFERELKIEEVLGELG